MSALQREDDAEKCVLVKCSHKTADFYPSKLHKKCTVVLVGVVIKGSLGGTSFDGCIKFIQVVVFSKVTI